MTRQFAVENLFAVIEDQRAVFRDEGDLIFQLREEGDELVILVAAGDNKFNVAALSCSNCAWKRSRSYCLASSRKVPSISVTITFTVILCSWVTAFETF